MKVTISSSSSDSIDDKYKKSAREVIRLLAENNFDLIWGSGSTSIMGISYEEFSKKKRKIYGYTTNKYINAIKELPKATHVVLKDTFDLKKRLFEDADLIIFLPGGSGTISEFFASLEEVRSNDKEKLLIVYNCNNWFDSSIVLIEDLIKNNFNSDSIYDYFKVVNNIEELKSELSMVIRRK